MSGAASQLGDWDLPSLLSGSTLREPRSFMNPDIGLLIQLGPFKQILQEAGILPTSPQVRNPGLSPANWPLCVFTVYLSCTNHSTLLRGKHLPMLSRYYISEMFGEHQGTQGL